MMLDGHEVDRFIFIAVGKDAPYPVGVYELDAESLHEGDLAVQYALEQYAGVEEQRVGLWVRGFANPTHTQLRV